MDLNTVRRRGFYTTVAREEGQTKANVSNQICLAEIGKGRVKELAGVLVSRSHNCLLIQSQDTAATTPMKLMTQ